MFLIFFFFFQNQFVVKIGLNMIFAMLKIIVLDEVILLYPCFILQLIKKYFFFFFSKSFFV